MSMTFVFTLSCGVCKTGLRFEDERPAWKTYDYRVEQSDDCERAAAFVAMHADEPLPALGEDWTAWQDAGRPYFIAVNGWPFWDRQGYIGDGSGLALSIPDPYRYIDCPVCDARIREPKA